MLFCYGRIDEAPWSSLQILDTSMLIGTCSAQEAGQRAFFSSHLVSPSYRCIDCADDIALALQIIKRAKQFLVEVVSQCV